jgi:hypothetical protein
MLQNSVVVRDKVSPMGKKTLNIEKTNSLKLKKPLIGEGFSINIESLEDTGK